MVGALTGAIFPSIIFIDSERGVLAVPNERHIVILAVVEESAVLN